VFVINTTNNLLTVTLAFIKQEKHKKADKSTNTQIHRKEQWPVTTTAVMDIYRTGILPNIHSVVGFYSYIYIPQYKLGEGVVVAPTP